MCCGLRVASVNPRASRSSGFGQNCNFNNIINLLPGSPDVIINLCNWYKYVLR